MHAFTIDENAKDRYDGKYAIYKRRFVHSAPRLTATCRLLGHKAKRVDLKYVGANPHTEFFYECGRCGTRPINQAFPSGPWQEPEGGAHLEYWFLPKKLHDSWSLNFRVGNPGSENNFAGHVTCPLFGVYWGIEGYLDGLRRLLNDGDHYESREIGLAFHDGTFWVKLWAKRNSWSSKDPKWQQMNWAPADTIFGKRQNSHEVVDECSAIIPMPEGGYPATIKLERWERWRPRGRRHVSYSYDAKIDEPVRFIPVPGKGENSYDCGDDGVWSQHGPVPFRAGWVTDAISGMVKSALRDRERYASRDWTPQAGWSEGLVKR